MAAKGETLNKPVLIYVQYQEGTDWPRNQPDSHRILLHRILEVSEYLRFWFCSYQIMGDCWMHSPEERPTFTELVEIFDKILVEKTAEVRT